VGPNQLHHPSDEETTMANRVPWIIAAALLVLLAADARPATKSGAVKLQELKSQDIDKKAFKVSVGDRVKADCTYHIIPDFFGQKAISVHARIKNTSAKMLYYGYYVAFLDKDKNLITCSAFGGSEFTKLGPGKETNIGNVVVIPVSQLARIAFYQVTVLEDEKEFGK
jgi:hypothetical protein